MIRRIPAIFMIALLVQACGIFGGGDRGAIEVEENMTSSIGVNGYLWRASLDALAKLPLAQADSAGGLITTDWFADPEAPGERLKVTVLISDHRLRADALDVNVVRQEWRNGVWVNAPVQAGTEKKIEDTILSRARSLWIQKVDRG